MKKRIFFRLVILVLTGLWFNSLYAGDPGNRDTLWVTPSGIFLPPNTPQAITIVGYHDEELAGIAIPLSFKVFQPDLRLDSVRFHRNIFRVYPLVRDAVVDESSGKVTIFAIWINPLPAGNDTIATLYFTTGITWNPNIYLAVDTFTLQGGQSLEFVDSTANYFIPYYEVPYKIGDFNRDGKINMTDIVALINFIFRGGPPSNPVGLGDANRDGSTNFEDLVILLSLVFRNGPGP